MIARRPTYDVYLATRFDVELESPLIFSTLDIAQTLYVALEEKNRHRASQRDFYSLAHSVPDYLAVGNRRRISIWMRRQTFYSEVCAHLDPVTRQGDGMMPWTRLTLSPEAFLRRYLSAHGIQSKSPRWYLQEDVQVLPQSNYVRLSPQRLRVMSQGEPW